MSSSSYDLGGFKCGKREPKCLIYYPTQLEKGPFPIATYGHGMGGEIIDDLIKSVASLGIVVVAPATSGGKCDDHHWQDMLHALDGSKSKKSLHKALDHVDWNQTGIMGHSMGGFASIFAAAAAMKEPERYHARAVLASHGYIGDATASAKQITIPAMFTTGSEDHRQAVKGQFDACAGRPKVLAQVTGASHMEPMNPGRLNPFDAHFFGCHLASLKTSCDKVYGDGAGSMCKAQKMTVCDIVTDGPAPSPSPGPTPSPPAPSPPSPTPSGPPEKCQECFKGGCEQKMHKSDCKQCIQGKQWKCASSCKPFPFSEVLEWACGGSIEVVV